MKVRGLPLLASMLVILFHGLAPAQNPKPVILTANATFQQELAASPTTMGPSGGVGVAILVLSADRSKVDFWATFVGLSTPVSAAHFHDPANFGTNAGVKRNVCGAGGLPPCSEATIFNGTWSRTDTTQPLTDADVTALLAGQVYFNIHTMTNGGGEIRGQVIPISSK